MPRQRSETGRPPTLGAPALPMPRLPAQIYRTTGTPFAGHRWPPEVITTAVRWYFRYRLSAADVRDLLAERGIDVSARTVLAWAHTFGPLLAAQGRRQARPVGTTLVRGRDLRAGSRAVGLPVSRGRRGGPGRRRAAPRAPRSGERPAFFDQAIARRGVPPKVVITDKHAAYRRAVRRRGWRARTSARACTARGARRPRPSSARTCRSRTESARCAGCTRSPPARPARRHRARASDPPRHIRSGRATDAGPAGGPPHATRPRGRGHLHLARQALGSPPAAPARAGRTRSSRCLGAGSTPQLRGSPWGWCGTASSGSAAGALAFDRGRLLLGERHGARVLAGPPFAVGVVTQRVAHRGQDASGRFGGDAGGGAARRGLADRRRAV